MDRLDIIFDTVKSLNKHKRDTFIEIFRSSKNQYNSVVSIKVGSKTVELEIANTNPSYLLEKLQDEYEFVTNVHVTRIPPEKTEVPNRPQYKIEPTLPSSIVTFDVFKDYFTDIYQKDDKFPNFVFSPNKPDPAITLDKNGRLNPNISALERLGLGYNSTFAMGYNAVEKEIAIIPGNYGIESGSTYKLDSRNYASARHFAARYGFIGKKSLFELVGTSESNSVIAYIFKLVNS